MKATKQCYKCKQQFLREDLIEYTTLKSQTPHSYCKKCLQEAQEYEYFCTEICKIFGIKSPGAQINKERKILKEEYGYTDKTIIECLHFVYDIEHIKKLKSTLYFVNPTSIDKMMKYKRSQQIEGNKIVNAMNTTYTEYIVPIKEETERKKNILDPNDFLND